jgi:hypothetical protein
LAFLAGLGFLASLYAMWLFGGLVINTVRARGWVEHPCTIVSAEAEELHNSRGTSVWKAAAAYTWNWEGAEYRSNRVAFRITGDTKGAFDRDAAEELSAHRNQTFRCYVNPQNPAEAVLYRDMRWGVAVMWCLLICFPAGMGAALLGARARLRREKLDDAACCANPESPHLWRHDWAQGYIEDRGSWHSGWGRLLAAGLTAMLALTLGCLFLTDEWSQGRAAAAVVLTGLTCLVPLWMVRSILGVRRFGRLTFVPDAFPVRPGQLLCGRVPLTTPLQAPHALKAAVQVRVPVKNREVCLRADAFVQVLPEGLVIAVKLPAAPPVIKWDGPAFPVLWTLEIKTPRDFYSATFDLPVSEEEPEDALYS